MAVQQLDQPTHHCATGALPAHHPASSNPLPSPPNKQTAQSQAADDFRSQVLTPFFVNYAKKQGKTITADEFLKKLRSIQAQHLATTLKYLEPANALPVWSVTVTTKEGSSANLEMPTEAKAASPSG